MPSTGAAGFFFAQLTWNVVENRNRKRTRRQKKRGSESSDPLGPIGVLKLPGRYAQRTFIRHTFTFLMIPTQENIPKISYFYQGEPGITGNKEKP
jgi:hypothetical protein